MKIEEIGLDSKRNVSLDTIVCMIIYDVLFTDAFFFLYHGIYLIFPLIQNDDLYPNLNASAFSIRNILIVSI